jgi:dolichyl-phosphate beta-glucosyltransferase
MPQVAVVIPCFNEAGRLKIADLLAFLDAHPAASLCLVDDGSRDATAERLEAVRTARPAQVHVLMLPQNQGKAAAVRAGVLHAAKQRLAPILGYWDADLSTPLAEVDRLLEALATHPRARIAMGSRVKRLGANIERQTVRHVMGRVFATFARGILGFSVYDSQCGAKLFHADVADMLFGDPFLSRWLFDLELLARLRNNGEDQLELSAVEVPLREWREVRGSKLRPGDIVTVPMELMRLGSRYNRRR